MRIYEAGDPIEKESYTSRILLHFIRHGEKENDPNKINFEQLMTDRGKKQSLEKGKILKKARPTALAFAGRVIRSQEVAGFAMAGAMERDDVNGSETLEGLKKKLDQGINYGSKFGVDKRLSFSYFNKDYQDAVEKAYNEGRGLRFMVYESDKLAEELGDSKSSTASKNCANIAEILKKYISIAPRYDKIVKNTKRVSSEKVLERFMGSHAGVIDVFLCKLVEEIRGVNERDRLVEILGGQGFEYTEGFDVEIDSISEEAEPILKINYSKMNAKGEKIFEFSELISHSILNEMTKVKK